MSDLCPQCGNPAYLPSDLCNVIWHTGAKPFGTSVVQDIEANLQEQIEWVKSLADDLIAAEGREARLKEKLATCEKYRDAYAECDRIGTQAVRDLEAKLAKVMEALQEMKSDLEDGDDNSAYLICKHIIAELTGGKDG